MTFRRNYAAYGLSLLTTSHLKPISRSPLTSLRARSRTRSPHSRTTDSSATAKSLVHSKTRNKRDSLLKRLTHIEL